MPTRKESALARGSSQPVKDSPMHPLSALAFFFLTQAILTQQPTPILPDTTLTPGDTFDVTAEDVCVPRLRKESAGSASMA
jgi:hypothetical protein